MLMALPPPLLLVAHVNPGSHVPLPMMPPLLLVRVLSKVKLVRHKLAIISTFVDMIKNQM